MCGPLAFHAWPRATSRLAIGPSLTRRRGKLVLLAGPELPPPRQRNREQRAGGCRKERGFQSSVRRDLPPDRAAECHRPEYPGQEDGQAPSTHPIEQCNLRGYIKTREHDRPRRARDQGRRPGDDWMTSEPEHNQRDRETAGSEGDDEIGAEPLAHPGERERAEHGADADDRQQDAVE